MYLTVLGRHDLVQHLTVSAALTVSAGGGLAGIGSINTLTPLGWRHSCSVFAVAGKYTVESRRVDSGFGHQCGELGNEVYWALFPLVT